MVYEKQSRLQILLLCNKINKLITIQSIAMKHITLEKNIPSVLDQLINWGILDSGVFDTLTSEFKVKCISPRHSSQEDQISFVSIFKGTSWLKKPLSISMSDCLCASKNWIAPKLALTWLKVTLEITSKSKVGSRWKGNLSYGKSLFQICLL